MTPSVTIPSLGILYQVTQEGKTFWFGRVHGVAPTSEIDLTINTVGNAEPTVEQIRSIESLPGDYEFIISLLLTHLSNSFRGTSQEVSIDSLRQMYLLCAVELKSDNSEWWFTMEPSDVPTPYNFFPRFKVTNKRIVWSNVN